MRNHASSTTLFGLACAAVIVAAASASAEPSAGQTRPGMLSSSGSIAAVRLIASHAARADEGEPTTDLAGRYAVMREKHDTGCMITLDKSHTKGGDRAQLAPGCRDQGIVVFDPTVWQMVRGQLVLTARAGHKTKLEKHDDGVWAKDPKEGGKPLALKKL